MKKKMFGAILCSAALAMGMAMPAFAGSQDAVNGSAYDTTGSDPKAPSQVVDPATDKGTTDLQMTTYIDQINVSVPVSITIAAKAAGGDALTPNNARIQNYGETPVRVTKVESNTTGITGLKWTLVATPATGDPSDPTGSTPEANYCVKITPADVVLTDPSDPTSEITSNDAKSDATPVDLKAGATKASDKLSLIKWGAASSAATDGTDVLWLNITSKTSKVTNAANYLDNATKVANVVFTVEGGNADQS